MNQATVSLTCRTYISFNNNPWAFYYPHGFPFYREKGELWNISHLKTYNNYTSPKVLKSPMEIVWVLILQRPVFPSLLLRLSISLPSVLSNSIITSCSCWPSLSSMSTAIAFKSAGPTPSVCFPQHCLHEQMEWSFRGKTVSHPSSALTLVGFPLHWNKSSDSSRPVRLNALQHRFCPSSFHFYCCLNCCLPS